MIVTLFDLFITFFEIGFFTIGGGYAMIPLIQENVIANNWLTLEQLVDFIAISESTPGPFAINIATFVGTQQAGFLGGLMATLGVVLPSLLIIIAIAKFFNGFKENFFVQGSLTGLRPAVVGLIAYAIYTIVQTNLFDFSATTPLEVLNIRGFILLAVIGAIHWKWKKLHPGFIVLISAALGIIAFWLIPA